MSYYQGNDFKKPSGGKKSVHRDKRKYELGRAPTNTKFDVKDERTKNRVRGGGVKLLLKSANTINVSLPNEARTVKTRIIEVVETPSNPQNARFGIIYRGTIVKTELGLVKVTSRPGQDGVLNGVLIKPTSTS